MLIYASIVLLQVFNDTIKIELSFKTITLPQLLHRILEFLLSLVLILILLNFLFLILLFLFFLLLDLIKFSQSGRLMEADKYKANNGDKLILRHMPWNIVLKLLFFYIYQVIELLCCLPMTVALDIFL